MNAGLIRGDALRLPLRDASVDLVVTSPPYWALRSYTDAGEHYDGQIGSEDTPAAFLAALWAVLDECWRVLKPTGSVFVNLGDKYANDAKWGGSTGGKHVGKLHGATGIGRGKRSTGVPAKSLMLLPEQFRLGAVDPQFREWKTGQAGPQWIARSVVIWDKPNGLPESVTDRVRRSHEDWVHLTKQGRYFAAVDEIREAYAAPDATRTLGNVDSSRGDHGQPTKRLNAADCMNPLGKLPGSVWTIPSEPLRVPEWLGVDHFAAFPQEFPRRIILGWSPSGVCFECGFLLGSSYDNGMLGVRGADNSRSHRRPRVTASGAQDQQVLHQGVQQQAHGQEQNFDVLPSADDARVRRGVDAESSDGAEERLHDGAPAGDVGAPGQAAASIGGCSPHQRGQDRQQDRELGAAGQGGARQAPQAAAATVPVPSLRRAGSDVRHAQSCPNCGGGSIGPGVIADPFSGTGTTVMVARALGRYGVGVDLSADYLRLARWRVFDSGHAAKTIRRTNEAAQLTMLA